MRTAGIIAEYNPFHNGHAWQIAELKKRGFEAVVCVCSPGVVQRGTAALFPARVRTPGCAGRRGGPGAQPAGTLRYAVRRGLCSGGCGAAECAGLCGCSVFRHRDTAAGGYRPNRSAAGKPGLSSSAARAAGRGPAAPRPPARRRRKRCVREQARCCARPMTSWAWNTARPCCASTAHLCPLRCPGRGAAHDAPLDAAPGRYASASALRALVRARGSGGSRAACAASLPAAVYAGRGRGLTFWTGARSVLRCCPACGLWMRRVSAPCGARPEGLENRLAAAVQGAGTLDELVQAMRTKRYATARLRPSGAGRGPGIHRGSACTAALSACAGSK